MGGGEKEHNSPHSYYCSWEHYKLSMNIEFNKTDKIIKFLFTLHFGMVGPHQESNFQFLHLSCFVIAGIGNVGTSDLNWDKRGSSELINIIIIESKSD